MVKSVKPELEDGIMFTDVSDAGAVEPSRDPVLIDTTARSRDQAIAICRPEKPERPQPC